MDPKLQLARPSPRLECRSDPATGTQIGNPLTGHTNAVTEVAFGQLPDGQTHPPRTSWRGSWKHVTSIVTRNDVG
jgi:hypothetical protein